MERAAGLSPWVVLFLITAVVGCSFYANLSLLVKDSALYRFFPPFQRNVNRNHNDHLGAEYYSIARAIVAGRGYADPFRAETGPTAWMAPVLPCLLAGLHWVTGGDKEAVTALMILLQDLALIASGIMVVALTRRFTGWVWAPAMLYVAAIVFHFRHSFQFTHDCWLILLTLNLFVAGLVWTRPLEGSWRRAAAWGVFGGFCALVSPVLGFVWGIFAVATGVPRGRRLRFGVAVTVSILTITPWVVRNYLVFGRFIPVKSNLVYELYQSQCQQPGGVLKNDIFSYHPYASNNAERRKYKQLGETAFLDEKRDKFWQSVRANPRDFADRVANRFFAATLLYAPFSEAEETRRPAIIWLSRIVYPLPFLAMMLLALRAAWRPLPAEHWVVIGAYLSYLLPYVVVSYYDRYKYPLLAIEVLLVFFAAQTVFAWLPRLRRDAVVEVAVEVGTEARRQRKRVCP